MKIYFNGVGDAFSTIYNNTSFVVEDKGFNLLIECPHPIFKIFKEINDKIALTKSNITWPKLCDIDSVYISHAHGDHMNGLEGFAFHKKFIEKKEIELYIPAFYYLELWHRRLELAMDSGIDQDGMNIHFDEKFYFNKHALYQNKNNRIGPFNVELKITKHHIPGYAIKLTNDEGKSVGFSSDTRFDVDLIKWLSSADKIIHETNYGPGHTNFSDLLLLSDDIKDKMILIHYPDSFSTSKFNMAKEGEVCEI